MTKGLIKSRNCDKVTSMRLKEDEHMR